MRMLAAAVLLALAAVPLKAVPPPVPAASPEDWAELVRTAHERPDIEDQVDGHRVYGLVRETAVPGQNCAAAGRRPRNQLFISEPLPGAPFRVYYMRISSLCVGHPTDSNLHVFMLDADERGIIQDWSLSDERWHVVSGITGAATPAQQRRLDELRASLVDLFLGRR